LESEQLLNPVLSEEGSMTLGTFRTRLAGITLELTLGLSLELQIVEPCIV